MYTRVVNFFIEEKKNYSMSNLITRRCLMVTGDVLQLPVELN